MLAVPRINRAVAGVGGALLAVTAFCVLLAAFGIVAIATSNDPGHTFAIGDLPVLVAAACVGVPGALLRALAGSARRTALRERDRDDRLREDGVRSPGTVFANLPARSSWLPRAWLPGQVAWQPCTVQVLPLSGSAFEVTLSTLRRNPLVPGLPVTVCFDPADPSYAVPLDDLDDVPRV